MKLERIGDWVRVVDEPTEFLEGWLNPNTGAYIRIYALRFSLCFVSAPADGQPYSQDFKTHAEALEFAREIMGGKDETS